KLGPEKRPDCARLSRLSVSQPVERLVHGWQIALELPLLRRLSFAALWSCLSLLLGPLRILGSTILRFDGGERMALSSSISNATKCSISCLTGKLKQLRLG